MRFENKTIIVTGSTMGIGEAIARRLHAEGASVLVHGMEEDLGKAIVADLGERAALHIDDLADPESAKRLVDAALNAFGKIDGIVNNAAIVATGNIETTDVAHWDRIMAVNVRAAFLIIQAALPHLAATKGSVVNIGSVNAYSGEEDLLPYSVSKGAIMTLTRNLGDILHRDHGIRVNQINPGWILTKGEHARKVAQGHPEDWPSKVPNLFNPSGRLIKPEEIAEGVLYFLSDACGPISGSVVELEQHPLIGRNPAKH